MAEKKTVEKAPEIEPKKNDKVKINLFYDGDKYKDDVFVCVNGKAIQIQRGKDVEIGKEYAEVLENSAKQDAKTAKLINDERRKGELAARALL
jgi:hypothetical protein